MNVAVNVVAGQRKRVKWRRHAEGYFFMAPWLIGFLVLVPVPWWHRLASL